SREGSSREGSGRAGSGREGGSREGSRGEGSSRPSPRGCRGGGQCTRLWGQRPRIGPSQRGAQAHRGREGCARQRPREEEGQEEAPCGCQKGQGQGWRTSALVRASGRAGGGTRCGAGEGGCPCKGCG